MSDSNFEHFLADLEERDVQYGELARLAFDCSSRLDRCLAWCDREIEWLSRGPTAYGEGRLKSVQEIKAILVERHEHNYGDDGRCSCGEHALGDGPAVYGFPAESKVEAMRRKHQFFAPLMQKPRCDNTPCCREEGHEGLCSSFRPEGE